MTKSTHDHGMEEVKPSIKGALLAPLYNYLVRKLNESEFNDFIAGLPPKAREVIEVRPLASNWYCAESANLILKEFTSKFSETATPDFRDLGRVSFARNLKTVYSHISTYCDSADNISNRVALLWKMFSNTGTVRTLPIKAIEKNLFEAEMIVSNWTGHGDVLCTAILGCIEALAKSVNIDLKVAERTCCISKGDADCRFLVRWCG